MDGADNFVSWHDTTTVANHPTAKVPLDGDITDAYHMYLVWQNPDSQNASVTFDGIECKLFGQVTPPADTTWVDDDTGLPTLEIKFQDNATAG